MVAGRVVADKHVVQVRSQRSAAVQDAVSGRFVAHDYVASRVRPSSQQYGSQVLLLKRRADNAEVVEGQQRVEQVADVLIVGTSGVGDRVENKFLGAVVQAAMQMKHTQRPVRLYEIVVQQSRDVVDAQRVYLTPGLSRRLLNEPVVVQG